MVVTRSGEHKTSIAPAALRTALEDPDISEVAKKRALRKLDGFDSGEEMPAEVEQAAAAALDEGRRVEEEDKEDLKEENDLDPETVRNTHANECMTPKRMLRRRASSKLNSSPDSASDTSSSSAGSPPKHVGFVDETQPTHMLEGQKATLHDPRASEARKEHARELLAFHGEVCE